jgi:ribosomal protein S18 acetylase RimI-like enzyme
MDPSLTVESARPAEWQPAFHLIFQHLDAEEQEARVGNALRLLRLGELDSAGLFVLRGPHGLLGAMVCLPVPGASGLVWPPQVVAGPDRGLREDQLVRHASAWLQQRGAKLAQALLAPAEAYLAVPLERNGFVHITSLWYLRHGLNGLASNPGPTGRLTYEPYHPADREAFGATLLRTYEGTRDCPEVNGVRELGEILDGHAAQGAHPTKHWWLAREQGRPVGVLLLADVPDLGGWDLSYVGVVPEARRRGLGRDLAGRALCEARAAGAPQLTLAVDTRNLPAQNLYLGLGFEPFDRREVYLAIWKELAPAP